jgi:Asp-tRNA(Asn)/Glu-tRNA(Gln) amidotransferase A subunit family amidase
MPAYRRRVSGALSRGPPDRAADVASVSPAAVLIAGLRAGTIDASGLLEQQLDEVEQQRALNAFLWSDRDLVHEAGREPSRDRPLAGLPVALKDNIDTAGIPTTSGSLVDRDRVPERDAAAWQRLRDVGGARLLGKTHMSEFAYRSHHPALGWVRNPRDPSRATGGSSSGSAAAVAAGIVAAALGTDTGGSVRIPAAYCGVVGLKGSFGRIENEGLVPLSYTMDHVGVLAPSVTDAAIVFQQLSREPLRLVDPDRLVVEGRPAGRLRVGVERGYFGSGGQPAILASVARIASGLERAGCQVVDVRLPSAAAWRAAHKVILVREAWQYHAPRLRADAPYGPVFRKAISAGEGITVARYRRALGLREAAIDELAGRFQGIDVLLTPTTPTVAPPADEGRRSVGYTRYTTLAAFAGLPAISIPCGSNRHGLPIGAQLIAAHGAERTLIQAAVLVERVIAAGRSAGGHWRGSLDRPLPAG